MGFFKDTIMSVGKGLDSVAEKFGFDLIEDEEKKQVQESSISSGRFGIPEDAPTVNIPEARFGTKTQETPQTSTFNNVVKTVASLQSPAKKEGAALSYLIDKEEPTADEIFKSQSIDYTPMGFSSIQGEAVEQITKFAAQDAFRAAETLRKTFLEIIGKDVVKEASPMSKSIFGSEGPVGEELSLSMQEQYKILKDRKWYEKPEGYIGIPAAWIEKKTGLPSEASGIIAIGLITLDDVFPGNPGVKEVLKGRKIISAVNSLGTELATKFRKVVNGENVKLTEEELSKIVEAVEKNSELTSIKTIEEQLDKKLLSFRQEAGMMADTTGAGTNYRVIRDARGNVDQVVTDFSLKKAKSNMKRQRLDYEKEAHVTLYENDPEYKKLYDMKESLLEQKIQRVETHEDIDELFDSIDNKTKELESQIKIYEESSKLKGAAEETSGVQKEIGTKTKTGETLEEFEKRIVFGKLDPEKETQPKFEALMRGKRKAQEAFTNQYTFLDKWQSDALKSVGIKQKKADMTFSQMAEQYAGVQGKQYLEAVVNFNEEVLRPIKKNYKDFATYLSLRRILARTSKADALKELSVELPKRGLTKIKDLAVKTKTFEAFEAKVQDSASMMKKVQESGIALSDIYQSSKNLKKAEAQKVADFETEEAVRLLRELHDKLGADTFKKVEEAGNNFQRVAKRQVDLLVDSGVLSKEAGKAVSESSDFYAPFKVMKYVSDKAEESARVGQSLNVSKQDVVQALKGMSDTDFKLFDPVAVMSYNIARTRALADKNKLINRLVDTVKNLKVDESFLRPLKKGESVPKGKGVITVMEKGKQKKYVVPEDVARAMTYMTPAQHGVIRKMLNFAAKPFKFGAITANVGFQLVNLTTADMARNFLLNKYYGLDPVQLIQFPIDYLRGFAASVSVALGHPNALAREFIESGAMGSTIARVISPESFYRAEKGKMLSRVLSVPQTFLARTGDVVETTSKIAGFQPGVRQYKKGKATMEEVVREVRNYAGSPDFSRRGSVTKDWNILFMFFNARLQGVGADLRRLGGLDKEAAQAWTKLTASVAIPATALQLYNLSPENREDYEKIPQWERDNYFMIPTSILYGKDHEKAYFINEDGERVRDYWKIPKREVVKLVSNVVEDGIKMVVDKDPSQATNLVEEFVEGISPVNIEGKTAKERAMSVISSTNPLIKIPLETIFGQSTFQKRDIEPEYINGERTENLPPEKRYKDSTPEIYVTLGEQLHMSPLVLENMIAGATGGLAGYVAKKRGQKGDREVQYSNPVKRRFIRSPYTGPTEAEEAMLESAKEAEEVSAIKGFESEAKAKDVYEMLKAGEVDQGMEIIKGMDEKERKDLKKIIEDDAKGLSYQDEQLLSMKDNYSKAVFIVNQLSSFETEEEIVEFLKKMKEIGMITDGVREKMKEVLEDLGEPSS